MFAFRVVASVVIFLVVVSARLFRRPLALLIGLDQIAYPANSLDRRRGRLRLGSRLRLGRRRGCGDGRVDGHGVVANFGSLRKTSRRERT